MKAITFTDMGFVRTILGHKRQERRIITPQPDNIRSFNKSLGINSEYELLDKPWTPCPACHFLTHENKYLKPCYKIGETLNIKEPYSAIALAVQHGIQLNLPGDMQPFLKKKKKKYLTPYCIKITGIRAGRIQNISNEDCIKEGVIPIQEDDEMIFQWTNEIGPRSAWCRTPQSAYSCIVDQSHGIGTWDANPFVWIYDYELLKT